VRAELELGARLRAAELEPVDLRAIRDDLLPPTLVQREGMSIAVEVIPAEPYVGGDFFLLAIGRAALWWRPSGTRSARA
jgi:serine phosphatase RsbU (regulator of sigma subunit)